MKALGGRPPILVGASMGGGTSLLAAGEGRLEAAAVVLVAGGFVTLGALLAMGVVAAVRRFCTRRRVVASHLKVTHA